MYRKFYSYNDMPVLKTTGTPQKNTSNIQTHNKSSEKKHAMGLETDDIILLVIFFILIMDNCEDRLLLLALAFVFFSDYFIDN